MFVLAEELGNVVSIKATITRSQIYHIEAENYEEGLKKLKNALISGDIEYPETTIEDEKFEDVTGTVEWKYLHL